MQRILTSLLPTVTCFLLAFGLVARAEEKKAEKVDPTGTWTWSAAGRDGQTRQVTLKLKMDGDKLTGTISGRQNETPIEDAKLKENELSFKVTREFQGNKFTQKYAGKISGDTLKGKIEFERDGQTQSRDWDAKREVAKPTEEKK